MIKIIVTITAFLISSILLAQVSENREVAAFSKLQASQGIAVFYTISNTKSVKVETDNSENLKFIKTVVENNVLKLYVDSNKYKTNNIKTKSTKINKSLTINGIDFKVLKITVSGPNLEAIKASSSADVKIENWNKTTNLDIAVSSSGTVSGMFECTNVVIDAASSGHFSASINAKKVEIESSSAAHVVLSGIAHKIYVKASSSSDCNLKKSSVDEAVIKASSAAKVVVNVAKSINAAASSSADIVFYGNPSEVKKEESSAGSITKK